MFSSSTAKGSRHRWRCSDNVSRPARRACATCHCCDVLRQTPFGVEVVPDVNVIFWTLSSGAFTIACLASYSVSGPPQGISLSKPSAAA